MAYLYKHRDRYGNRITIYDSFPEQYKAINTHFEWVDDAAPTAAAPAAPQVSPVSPTIDPKLEANALYGKPMALSAMGYARIGASPAPIVGPYFNGDIVEFIVSFGVPVPVDGDRKIYKIWLDNELAWSSDTGGTLPGDGTFAAAPFDFVFTPGTLTQGALSMESERFPGDECAYRPQMVMQIRNLAWARFQEVTGKPVPYVAVDIGDVTDGAVPQDGINLGFALEQIAWSPWPAMTPDEFEAVDITDVVDAILLKDNFSVIQLCQNICGEYRNLDLRVSDKVRIKDRGGNVSPDFIFDRDTIIGDDGALSVARANATAQRREHELFAIDPDQDYTAVASLAKIPRDPIAISAAVGKDTSTLPVVIDANTRQALATFALNYLENSRRTLSFKVPAFGYEIEPGDMFALSSIANGFDNEVFKVTQSTHGANWVVDVEGEAILRCSIFSGFDGATFDPATIALVTLSGGNLVATNTGTNQAEQGARVAAVSAKSSGKYYFEMVMTVGLGGPGQHSAGIGPPTSSYADLGNAVGGVCVHRGNGEIWAGGAGTGIHCGSSLIPNGWDIRIAVDLDNRKIWFSLFNGATSTNWNDSALNDPVTNVGGMTIPSGAMVPFCSFTGLFGIGSSGNQYTANFGSSPFATVVPSGFTPGWPP